MKVQLISRDQHQLLRASEAARVEAVRIPRYGFHS